MGICIHAVSPENEKDVVGIEVEQVLVWNTGEVANITWQPSSLVMSEVIDNINVKVDVSLLLYNEQAELEQALTLATDLPNTGAAQVGLPISQNIPTSQHDVYAAVLQLSVNTSTTMTSVTKRDTHQSKLMKLLQWAKKFTKATLVRVVRSAPQIFIAQRLACEAWSALSSPVPLRRIPPCPCTDNHARNTDERFVEDKQPEILRRFFHKGSKSCFRQGNARYTL